MRKIIVSIFPSYKCNENCEFCYLWNNHTDQVLDLNILQQRLNEITKYFQIDKFNTYGGEITLLDTAYLKGLNSILNKYNVMNYISSNLYNIDKLDLFTNSYIGSSLNVERKDYEYIRTTLKENKGRFKNLCVLSMITPSILNNSAYSVLSSYNNLGIDWVSFIKYYPSINTGDVFSISQEQYEECLIELLDCYLHNKKDFDFSLALVPGLENCLNRTYPIATNDQCVRIGPDGKLGAIYYTEDNLEYFKWYDTIEEFIEDGIKDKKEYTKKCITCKYYGTCWTEHITNLECDGCKKLLQYMEGYLNGK